MSTERIAPGGFKELGPLNWVIAKVGARVIRAPRFTLFNVLGQHLKTNETLGYVIVDVDRGYPKEALEELKAVNGTLKFRSLM